MYYTCIVWQAGESCQAPRWLGAALLMKRSMEFLRWCCTGGHACMVSNLLPIVRR